MSREGMLLVTKIPPAQRATKLGIIIQKLEDPEFDAREIERYILIELATVTREI